MVVTRTHSGKGSRRMAANGLHVVYRPSDSLSSTGLGRARYRQPFRFLEIASLTGWFNHDPFCHERIVDYA